MATSEVIGNLAVIIGADISGLQKGVGDAKKELTGLQGGIGGLVKSLSLAAAAAVAAGAAIITGLAHSGLEAVDAQSKLARSLGGTILGVQALQLAGKLGGLEDLAGSVARLNTRLGEAIRDGMSPAADALRRLGLNAAALSAMDVDARMAAIADAVKRLGFNSSQTSDMLKELGIRGGKLTEIMMAGGNAFRESRRDVIAFGAAVSNIDGRRVEEANDSWTKLSLLVDALKNQLALFIAQPLNDLAEKFQESAKEGKNFGVIVRDQLYDLMGPVGFVADRVRELALYFNLAALGAQGLRVLANDVKGIWSDSAKLDAELAKKQYDDILVHLRMLWNATPPSAAIKEYIELMKLLDDYRKGWGDDPVIKPPKGGESISSKEIKQYQEKLQRLKESVASEDAVIDLQQADRLKKLDEYAKKLGLSDELAYGLRKQIREKHDQDMANYITNTLEAGILSETEILKRKTELQLQQLKTFYDNQLEQIRLFEANKDITAEQAEARRAALAQGYSARQVAIVKNEQINKMQAMAAGASSMASIVDTSMAAITALISDGSGKNLAIVKAIGIASALVHGFESAVAAYAAGWKFGNMIGNPFVGEAMAVAAAGISLAGTGAIIAKIAGVGSGGGGGGGGGVPSGGGGALESAGASAANSGGQQSGSVSQVNISGLGVGDIFSGKQIRDLIKRINEAAGDGVLIKVGG